MANDNKGLTPMMRQFFEMKSKHPEALLLFRCGDFYETYCEDAVEASRILGMGDVMSLIEKAQANIDEEKAKAMEQKMKKAQFDFNDYLDSMEQMRNMGGISSILNMLPGVGAKMKGPDLESMVDEKDMARKEAIVLSMTPKERENPDLINPSRKQRIAKGAGVDIAEVNRFIKQFEQSRKMMKQMTGMVGKGGKRGGFKLPF